MFVGKYRGFQSKTPSLPCTNTALFAGLAVLSFHIANIGLLLYGLPTRPAQLLLCVFVVPVCVLCVRVPTECVGSCS